MRLCWFNDTALGLVDGDHVVDVSAALSALPRAVYPAAPGDLLVANLAAVCAAIGRLTDAPRHSLAEVRLGSPVANPGKIVAAPVNYRAHLEEAIADEATFSRAHVRQIRETGLFLKATSSLIGPDAPIVIRHGGRRTDHEIELVAIIGKTCRGVSRAEALDCVAAYTIGLDITIRGPEERSLRKSLDSYSVLGPWMVTADAFGDPAGREMLLTVNGETRQHANTRDLILDLPDLIEFASAYYTLYPGDILFTGTPEGVGPIEAGDRIVASIEGIGVLTSEVVAG